MLGAVAPAPISVSGLVTTDEKIPCTHRLITFYFPSTKLRKRQETENGVVEGAVGHPVNTAPAMTGLAASISTDLMRSHRWVPFSCMDDTCFVACYKSTTLYLPSPFHLFYYHLLFKFTIGLFFFSMSFSVCNSAVCGEEIFFFFCSKIVTG